MSKPNAPVHRTILVVDVERFGDPRRSDVHRLAVRESLFQILDLAFRGADIRVGDCRLEDRGDGIILIAPPSIPAENFVKMLPGTLAAELKLHNRIRNEEGRIRLRLALHEGPVHDGENGMTSSAVVLAARLVDSAELRQDLATSPGTLGIIASDQFFRSVVQPASRAISEHYRPVRVAVKEITSNAWISLPDDPNPPTRSAHDDGRVDFTVCFATPDQRWAEWIIWQLREEGYTADLDPWDGISRLSPTQWLVEAGSRADRILLLLSSESTRTTRGMTEVFQQNHRVTFVQVEPTDFRTRSRIIELNGVGAETARQRLLASVVARRVPRGAPAFPGNSSPDNEDAPLYPEGLDDPLALVVHAVEDRAFAAELAESLRVLVSERVLSPVDLHAVAQVDEASNVHADSRILRADVVVVVISRDLLATGYGVGREMRVLLRRQEERRTAVLPVVFRETSWRGEPIGKLPALPTGGRPVNAWASRDAAIKNIVDGVRIATLGLREKIVPVESAVISDQEVIELGTVFKPAGVPTLTFVEPDDFIEFRMALRQPGLGVVVEGPSGIGKTTLLKHTVERDLDRLGEVSILSARRPGDLAAIRRLPDGHTGLVAVDDFQRLPRELQDQLADYLKLLADDDKARGKLVIVGIPGTAQNLVEVSPDVATRIRVFRLGKVAESLVLQMVDQGEAALNITFDGKADIALESAGSLLTAQMLCWHTATMAGVERTESALAVVRTDIGRARAKVTDTLHLKYRRVVDEFITMDEPSEPLCIELLLSLAATPDGILRLQDVAENHPKLRPTMERLFVDGLPNGLHEEHPLISEHLFYDPRGKRLVVDDPQFVYYLRQQSREALIDIAGKNLPVPRDQIFVCYSRKDAEWLDRIQVHFRPLEREGTIDLWSDRRIELGDRWRKEIAGALARARVALLLISADFFDSDFIHSEELPPLLAAEEERGCRVVPVLLKPSMFDRVPSLARFQCTPSGTTLSELTPERRERVFAELAHSVSTLFGE